MSSALITADTTVRQALTRYPHLIAIFEGHGLSGCGGSSGPEEPIAFFAAVHKVDAQALLRELNEKALLAAPASAQSNIGIAPSYYRLFLRTSLLLAVSVGFVLGAVALASRVRLLPLGLYGPLVPVHGHLQLYGWAGLFLMGIAYHVLPRFVGRPLPGRRLPLVSYSLVVSGMSLWSLGSITGQPWLQVAGGVLEVGGAALFLFVIGSLALQGPEDFFSLYLATGALWFVVASALGVAGRFQGYEHFRGASEHLFLIQFTGMFVLGVSQRTLPFFLGLRQGPQLGFLAVWFLLNLGVALRALGLGLPGAMKLSLLGTMVEGVALLLFIYALNILRRSQRGQAPPGERSFSWFLRAAYLWLGLAVALEMALLVRQLATGLEPTLGQTTAFRHAFAVGFVTMAMMGMASRIVPVFEGHALHHPRLMWASFWSLNLGLVLRLGGELWSPVAGFLAPSGVLMWLALALFVYCLWPTLHPARAQATAAPLAGKVVTGAMKVAEVLDRYPATLEVFLRRGFTPLRDEALRRTMATQVTVQQVCAMHSVDPEGLLRELNEAATGSRDIFPQEPVLEASS